MGENKTERCSAYVVIPAPVFFDRSLPPSARLLYGLISNLCNDRGYCWAKNETLCRYLEVKERTLRGLLEKLREGGYIEIDQRNQGGQTERRICLVGVYDRPAKNCRPPGKNLPDPRQKIAAHTLLKNNKENNITPLTPQGGEDLDLSGMTPELAEAVTDWISYKRERRFRYQPTGLKRLLSQIRTYAAEYGDPAVIDVISQSIASGYQGIVWDRIRKSAPQVCAGAEVVAPDDPGDWY